MTSHATETPNPRLFFGLVRRGFAERILGLLLRHYYLTSRSLPRLIDLFYWQTLNMVTWGFLNFYLTKESTGIGFVASALLGCAIMWDVMVRTQISVMMPFMEELWSRNVGNIFVSPFSPKEYAAGLVILSLIRTLISMTPCFLLAWAFFGLWLPGFGWPMLVFWFNLAMCGWWGGLVLISMLLRFGTSAEWLIWMLVFIIAPFVGAYYPVDILPPWVQTISWLLPPTYVFEGLRAILQHGQILIGDMLWAFGLNLVYLSVGLTIFLRAIESTRRRSGLLQLAE